MVISYSSPFDRDSDPKKKFQKKFSVQKKWSEFFRFSDYGFSDSVFQMVNLEKKKRLTYQTNSAENSLVFKNLVSLYLVLRFFKPN